MTEREIEEKAIKVYGEQHQIDMCIEEMAELTKALLKGRRYPEYEVNNIYEEIADVEIMIEQMKIIYGEEFIDNWKEYKLNRLEERMNEND